MRNNSLKLLIAASLTSLFGCSSEITNESHFALPLTEQDCKASLFEIRDTFRSRGGPTDEPPFPNAYLLESAAEAFENLGYSLDATLRSIYFTDWAQYPHCRELASLLPASHVEAAMEQGVITKRTANVIRFMERFDGLELSNATTRVIEATQECERAFGAPCELRKICDYFDEGILHEVSGQHVGTCQEMFDASGPTFEFVSSRVFLRADTDFFQNPNGSSISSSITPNDAWTINHKVMKLYQDGYERMIQEKHSFR